MITEFGQIKSVDLREGWPNEAQDFTPWLEQHISLLGDALGLELEVQEREAPVGGFSLDLLARDLGRNKTVVIENQLTATDHVHLGQVLTYGAGFDAGAVIWLAKTFRDEHRQAIDWLNQHTGEGVEFFGVEIQLLKIDESKLAPNFKLVATPNHLDEGEPARWRWRNVGKARKVPELLPGTDRQTKRAARFYRRPQGAAAELVLLRLRFRKGELRIQLC